VVEIPSTTTDEGDPFAAYNAGIHNARRAYAEDPSHRWCARGCFNLARVGAYCSSYCADLPRPHRRGDR
jgi:hypothetical protein